MANSKTLFSQPDVKNNPHRSGFDLSKRKLFTAKVGELLPVYCRSVIPGDHFKFSAQSFTRTQPVQTSAFTRIQEYVDFFFVPYRILWRNFPASFTQMQDAKNIAQSLSKTQSINDMLPYVTMGDLLKCICKNLPLNGDTNVGPAYTTLDEVGANKKQSIFKLLSYLGYGDFDRFGSNTGLNVSPGLNVESLDQYFDTSKKLSLLPLLAYQKIYFDFYRNTQWEEDRAQAHNVDYMTDSTNIADYDSKPNKLEDLFNSGILSLRYANYAKDLLLGLLPNAQFGDVAEITLSSSSTYGFIPQGSILSNGTKVVDKQSNPLVSNDIINGGKYAVLASSSNSEIKTDSIRTTSDVSISFDKINSAFNALDIRNLMATQRWREIANTGDRTYRSQIEKHFGVHLPQMLENNCVYIDGWKGSVAINEVVNTNLQSTSSDDNSPKATIEGKGVGDIDGHDFDFDVKEHGLILGIYHAVPIMDYSLSAPNRDNQIVNISDMFIPEYDKLGYESVLPTDFFQITQKRFNAPLIISQLGYAPRYWQYKTDVDEVVGAFRTSLVDWVAPFDDSYLKNSITLISANNYKLDYRFFKVNASILDDIFGVNAHLSYFYEDNDNNLSSLEIDNDQLLVALDFTIFANRNMDFNGLPY